MQCTCVEQWVHNSHKSFLEQFLNCFALGTDNFISLQRQGGHSTYNKGYHYSSSSLYMQSLYPNSQLRSTTPCSSKHTWNVNTLLLSEFRMYPCVLCTLESAVEVCLDASHGRKPLFENSQVRHLEVCALYRSVAAAQCTCKQLYLCTHSSIIAW